MKKLIAAILCIATALSLIACGNTDLPAETIEKKDYSQYAGIVADPATWVEEFEKLPIANENMTTDELRQLACDAFKANLTFQWTPNKPVVYTYELLDNYRDVNLPTGQAYSGMCYATGIKDATNGTIYKVLSYYDKETGVLDVEAMGDHMLNIISSACSNGAQQGWNRVSCTHGEIGMTTFNPHLNPSIALVGPYTYEPYVYNHDFGSRTCTKEVIAFNGDQTMYESYAAMLPADGLYSASAWHVMMCSQKPVVVRNADGTINPEESYLHVHEQGAKGTNNTDYNEKQSNGVDIRVMGTIDNKKTFKQLLESGYLPFTFKVFTGEEKVQPGKAWLGSQDSPMENGQDLTLSQLFGKKIYTNYALLLVEVVVKNPDGEELVHYNPSINTSPIKAYETLLNDALQADRLAPYANGKNTIHIYARLSNGELVEAYNTILKAD